MEEYFYLCPYCFSEVSILVDLSVARQQYVEDCERCCNPIEFTIHCAQGEIAEVQVEPLGQ